MLTPNQKVGINQGEIEGRAALGDADGSKRCVSGAYSPIEHLAKTLCCSRDWPHLRLGMFTAAFDSAGTEHDQPFLVTAGFISSANDWIEFDERWRARLSRDDIKYFHMVEFAQSTVQFEGWKNDEPRRRALFADLLELISTYAYRRFGCAISTHRWSSRMSKTNVEQFRINAYCVAGMISVARVDKWARQERIGTPVGIVFEDGDIGKGMLQTRLSPRKPDPEFRKKKDELRDGVLIPAFTPLQAADLLAYEIFVALRKYDKAIETSGEYAPRYGLRYFEKMPEEIRYMEPQDFANLGGMLTGIDALL